MIKSPYLNTKNNFDHQFYYLLIVAAFIYSLSTVIHAITSYSGVPLWDSWLGMIDFLNNYKDEDISYWFSQHFEHRIFISRIFFWLNYIFFDGQNWLLIIINYSLAGLIFILFAKIIQELSIKEKYTKYFLIFITFIFTFSKIQNDNFSWEFQSQFFLAYLFPLFSLYLLGKSSENKEKSLKLFVFSCIFGITSALTMANGAFTLFFMAMAAFLLKIEKNKIFILLGLAFLTLFSYLYGYQKPMGHGFINSLSRPIDIFLYLISFLSSTVYFIFGSVLSKIFGFLLLILSLKIFLQMAREKGDYRPIDIILISFILYVIFSGLLTSIGRVATFSIEQAFAQRYSTPVFMAMLSMLVIHRKILARYFANSAKNKYIALLPTLPFLFFQIGMVDVNDGKRKVFEKNVAALALELEIMDEKQIIDQAWIAGDFSDKYYKSLIDISQIASKNNISIFGDPLVRDIKEKVGQKLTKNPDFCQKKLGFSTKINKIDKDGRFSFVSGKMDGEFKEQSLFLIDNKNIIVGYILIDKNHRVFKGYSIKNSFYLYNLNKDCRIEIIS